MTVPHRADFYQIIWISKGSATQFVDFNPVELSENSILFIPKDCVTIFDSSTDFDGKMILFTDEFYCKNQSDTQFLHSTILFNDLYTFTKIRLTQANPELITIISSLESEFNKPNDFVHYDVLRNQLNTFLLLSERLRREQGFKEIAHGTDLVNLLQYSELVETHFRNNKSVGSYASMLSITEKRLNKSTSMILGKTPKQIIDERVLLEAKRLIVHSSDSIKEIGFSIGFEEPTNFIKYFRKHTGKTPSEFRESYL